MVTNLLPGAHVSTVSRYALLCFAFETRIGAGFWGREGDGEQGQGEEESKQKLACPSRQGNSV